MLKIAVLSGKGGTGKTFVSTNLSNVIDNCTLLDNDVEEPNSRLFFKGEIINKESVYQKVPIVNEENCDNCRLCADSCKYNAIAFLKKPIILENVCHNCGLCTYICPRNAISEIDKEVGHTETLKVSEKLSVRSGFLNVLEESGTPIIDALNNYPYDNTVVVDCPPGSSCLVMESIRDSDFNLLVSEDTNFSFENFKAVYNLSKLFNKKTGLVINKKTPGVSSELLQFSKDNNIPVLLEIPFDKELSKISSNGELITNALLDYRQKFSELYKAILTEVSK